MHAVILSIGDELTLGQTIDSNSAWISSQLTALGIPILYHQTIPDNLPLIVSAIQQAISSAPLILVTGGLGPTLDDLTRDALAKVMQAPLILHEPTLQTLKNFFASRNRPMDPSNTVQAMYPQGSSIIANSRGTAPGLTAKVQNSHLYFTPGVPSEMHAMFLSSILPEIKTLFPNPHTILTEKINTFGVGESSLGAKIAHLMQRNLNPTVGTTVADGVVSVRIRAQAPSPQLAQTQLNQTINTLQPLLHPYAYSLGQTSLAQATLEILLSKQLTLATAESCTGGLLSQLLTDVPGSSQSYLGGWITYSNSLKQSLLNIPSQLLQQYGAVSSQTAQAMAENALQLSQAHIAVSVTGIAGPTGGSPEKPVGTVYVAMASRPSTLISTSSSNPIAIQSARLNLSGSRQAIRDRSAKTILQLIRFHLLQIPWESISWVLPIPTPTQTSP